MVNQIVIIIVLFSSLPAFAIMGPTNCQARLMGQQQIAPPRLVYPIATFIDSVELSALMEKHMVTLPPSNLRPGVLQSDRARARSRNLQAVLPALINRILKFQISYEDGQNGHLLGTIRRIVDLDNGKKALEITLEGYGHNSNPSPIVFPAESVTALNGVNHGPLVKATRTDLEAVRALRTTERSILGKYLKLGANRGVLVAAHLVYPGIKMYAVEASDGRVHWIQIPPDLEPGYTVE